MQTVYNDRGIPLEQLKQVSDLYAVNIVDTSHKVRAGKMSYAEGAKAITAALEAIDSTWQVYTSTYLTEEEKLLVVKVDNLRTAATSAANTLKSLMDQENQTGLEQFINNQMYADIDPLTAEIGNLVSLQLRVAGEEYKSAVEKDEFGKVSIKAIEVVNKDELGLLADTLNVMTE